MYVYNANYMLCYYLKMLFDNLKLYNTNRDII